MATVAVLGAGAGVGYVAAKGGSDNAPKAPTSSSAPAIPGNPNHSASPEAPATQEMDPTVQQLIEKFHLVKRDAGKYIEGTGNFGEQHKDLFPTTYYDLSGLQSAKLTDADKQAMARLNIEINLPVAVNTNNLNIIDPSKGPDDAPTPFPFIDLKQLGRQTLLGWPKSGQIQAINATQLERGLVVTPGSTDDGRQTFNMDYTKPIAFTGAQYRPPFPGLEGELPKSVAQPTITGDQISAMILRGLQLGYDDETRALVRFTYEGLGPDSFVQS